MITWLKNLGLSAKNWLQLGALAFLGSLFVLLRLKDREIHSLEVENMKEKFRNQDEKVNSDVENARKEYEDEKNNR